MPRAPAAFLAALAPGAAVAGSVPHRAPALTIERPRGNGGWRGAYRLRADHAGAQAVIGAPVPAGVHLIHPPALLRR